MTRNKLSKVAADLRALGYADMAVTEAFARLGTKDSSTVVANTLRACGIMTNNTVDEVVNYVLTLKAPTPPAPDRVIWIDGKAQQRTRVSGGYEFRDVREGETLEWENGLGITERETVFRSERTGRLAVAGALSSEISVYSLLQIDNGCRIA